MVVSRFFGSFMLALAIGISPVTIHAHPQGNQTKQQSTTQTEQAKAQETNQKNKKPSIKNRVLRALHLDAIRTEDIIQISTFVILCCLTFAYTIYTSQKTVPQYKPRNPHKPRAPSSDNHDTHNQVNQHENRSNHNNNIRNVDNDNNHAQAAEAVAEIPANLPAEQMQEEDNECCVCFEEFSDERRHTRLTPCNHEAMCNTCAYDWIFGQDKGCPMCRTKPTDIVEL